jgi:hypothetical protein
MKISASTWKDMDSKWHADRLRKDGVNSRERKREAARSQKTKVKTNKTNKGFK